MYILPAIKLNQMILQYSDIFWLHDIQYFLYNTTNHPWFVSDLEFVDTNISIWQPCANQESLRVIPSRTQNMGFFQALVQHPEP